MNLFEEKVNKLSIGLRKTKIEVLQVNLGKYCNLTCSHCHVESGPHRKEMMDEKTAVAVISFLNKTKIPKLDLTGGAPELNPNFKYLVKEGKKLKRHIMDRCNLTVFYEEGMDDLPEFLANHEVEVIASLPCYSKDNVDKQRGKGIFDKSIDALIWLNKLGYGNSRLILNLVYNPAGAYLPPSQETLEDEYRKKLYEDFGIVFNKLYTITNMPITRYKSYLQAIGKYEEYTELLYRSFNPCTVSNLMCCNTLSVSFDGKLYDCDFNQAIEMNINSMNGKMPTVFNTNLEEIEGKKIKTGNHCFGCTAGHGSSCSGVLT